MLNKTKVSSIASAAADGVMQPSQSTDFFISSNWMNCFGNYKLFNRSDFEIPLSSAWKFCNQLQNWSILIQSKTTRQDVRNCHLCIGIDATKGNKSFKISQNMQMHNENWYPTYKRIPWSTTGFHKIMCCVNLTSKAKRTRNTGYLMYSNIMQISKHYIRVTSTPF